MSQEKEIHHHYRKGSPELCSWKICQFFQNLRKVDGVEVYRNLWISTYKRSYGSKSHFFLPLLHVEMSKTECREFDENFEKYRKSERKYVEEFPNHWIAFDGDKVLKTSKNYEDGVLDLLGEYKDKPTMVITIPGNRYFQHLSFVPSLPTLEIASGCYKMKVYDGVVRISGAATESLRFEEESSEEEGLPPIYIDSGSPTIAIGQETVDILFADTNYYEAHYFLRVSSLTERGKRLFEDDFHRFMDSKNSLLEKRKKKKEKEKGNENEKRISPESDEATSKIAKIYIQVGKGEKRMEYAKIRSFGKKKKIKKIGKEEDYEGEDEKKDKREQVNERILLGSNGFLNRYLTIIVGGEYTESGDTEVHLSRQLEFSEEDFKSMMRYTDFKSFWTHNEKYWYLHDINVNHPLRRNESFMDQSLLLDTGSPFNYLSITLMEYSHLTMLKELKYYRHFVRGDEKKWSDQGRDEKREKDKELVEGIMDFSVSKIDPKYDHEPLRTNFVVPTYSEETRRVQGSVVYNKLLNYKRESGNNIFSGLLGLEFFKKCCTVIVGNDLLGRDAILHLLKEKERGEKTYEEDEGEKKVEDDDDDEEEKQQLYQYSEDRYDSDMVVIPRGDERLYSAMMIFKSPNKILFKNIGGIEFWRNKVKSAFYLPSVTGERSGKS